MAAALSRRACCPSRPLDRIVLIDDGSTDNSAAVIADFCSRHDCIRLIRHDINRGPLAAVATGIAAARGELLLFAAADDFILPGLLARQKRHCASIPTPPSFRSEVAVVDRARQVVGYRPVVPPRFTSGYVSPAAMRREIQRTDNWFYGPSVVYRRRLLAEIGLFRRSRSARFATAWRSGCSRSAMDFISPPRFSRLDGRSAKPFGADVHVGDREPPRHRCRDALDRRADSGRRARQR